MGCIHTEGSVSLPGNQGLLSNVLTVATLNYCGIMNSPFEFYCDDYLTELKEISKQFIDILPKYFPNFNKTNFKWEMGKIDLKFRCRYSPMFYLNAGIEDNKFISQEKFKTKWEEVFNVQMPKLKVQYKEEEKEVTKTYDVAMYHALLRYVYKTVEIKDAEKLPVESYIKKLEPLFNLSFLDENRKGEKVKNNFKRIDADVFFFQEYSQSFYDSLKKSDEYYLSHDESKDTLIIAKKSSFKQKPVTTQIFFNSHIEPQLKEKLNWSQRSAFMIIDKYIFISAHLSSKAEKNLPQIQAMKESLLELKKKLPDYDIIIGGDLNSFLEPYTEQFKFFPASKDDMTTVKKRTFTQGQFNKADKVVYESKDKIISSLKINQGKISYITGTKPNNQNLVPTDEHPFDHFVVVCYLEKRAQP